MARPLKILQALLLCCVCPSLTAQTYPGGFPTFSHVTIVTGTSYTLTPLDHDGLVESTNNAATTITIPNDSSVLFPVGTVVSLIAGPNAQGIATWTAAAGVTLNGGGVAPAITSYSVAPVTIFKSAANTWTLYSPSVFYGNLGTGNGICLGCTPINPQQSQNTTWSGWNGAGTGGSMILEDGDWDILTHNTTPGGAGTKITVANMGNCAACEPGATAGTAISYLWNEEAAPFAMQESNLLQVFVNETGNHTAALADQTRGYFLDARTGSLTLTLPAGNTATPIFTLTGYDLIACRAAADSSANTVTIAAAGSDKINGAASIILARYQCVELQSDAGSPANWYEISTVAAAAGPTVVSTAIDQTATSNTLIVDPYLVASNLATGNYALECDLFWSLPSTNGGIKEQLDLTAGTAGNSNFLFQTADQFATAFTANAQGFAAGVAYAGHSGNPTSPESQITGSFTVTAAATFNMEWAQDTTNASATTLKQGSWCRITKTG